MYSCMFIWNMHTHVYYYSAIRLKAFYFFVSILNMESSVIHTNSI